MRGAADREERRTGRAGQRRRAGARTEQRGRKLRERWRRMRRFEGGKKSGEADKRGEEAGWWRDVFLIFASDTRSNKVKPTTHQ